MDVVIFDPVQARNNPVPRLDPDKGIVAFDGSRAYAVPATQLVEIFGPDWRRVVYA